MSLDRLEIAGYRSVRSLRLPLRRVTVLVGANGVGKTNLYRGLQLLQNAAEGTLADALAAEGGLGSVFWAGGRNLTPDGGFDPRFRANGMRRHERNRLILGLALTDPDSGDALNYEIEIGFPAPMEAALGLEARIRRESLDHILDRGPVRMMERDGLGVMVRNGDGRREQFSDWLLSSETALSNLRGAFPAVAAVRQSLLGWRFHHGFRTDARSPLRRPCPAVSAPHLASDGSNLAAVFATLRYIREDSTDLDAAIAEAFPGAELVVPEPGEEVRFGLRFPDIPQRVFEAHELSDGTLQFLALLGALFSYRLPPLLALNEPENSLHPDLLLPLARAVARAAERTQIWVVTHSTRLAEAISDLTGSPARTVTKTDDGTTIEGLTRLGGFEDD